MGAKRLEECGAGEELNLEGLLEGLRCSVWDALCVLLGLRDRVSVHIHGLGSDSPSLGSNSSSSVSNSL